MWIIAGLGNPGSKYSATRHNIGFRVIDQLSEEYNITLEERDVYMIGKGAIDGVTVILLKPLTFMNRSGLAVKAILKKADISTDNLRDRLIVVHDDLDIDAGAIKIRRGGSSGGHRGIESIIQELETKDFVRIKVGIGRDKTIPVEEYVLQNFKPSEKDLIKNAIISASQAVTMVVTKGIDKAMNKFNRHKLGVKMIFLSFLVGFVFVPSMSFAWGPLTHIYLGSEIYSYAPLIPAGIMALLRKYRQDFLYGNLMADMILGKKYLPSDKSSHSWDMGLKLMEQAKKGPEKAFVYGYLSHLAADTVAHDALTEDKWDVGHAWIEIKADSLINKAYWLESITINKAVQQRNDMFLENSLDRFIFSFNTNKRIYKGMVFLSILNRQRRRGVNEQHIRNLHDESIASILDLLQNGENASVLNKSPL